MDVRTRFGPIDELRERWYGANSLDLSLVMAAHLWLLRLDQAIDSSERGDWLTFWREALEYVIERRRETGRLDSHPYKDERLVLRGVASVVQWMDVEENPGQFWQAIVDLPKEAHDWSEVFLMYFHQDALLSDKPPPRYVTVLRTIVTHVFQSGAGEKVEPKWSAFEDVWEALMGIDWITRDCWKPRHAPLVDEIADVFEVWASRVPVNDRHFGAFASWLSRGAAGSIRLAGLGWIDRRLADKEWEKAFEDTAAAEALASLLSVVWRENEDQLRRDATAFAAFRNLLRKLADQQNEIALGLLGQIGGL